MGAIPDRHGAARRALAVTTGLGIAFVALQAVCWFVWLGRTTGRWEDSDAWRLALTGFYVLTGLHTLHTRLIRARASCTHR